MDVELALNLYRNTMTGNWESIVEMYKINSSRDTALHVTVSIAPENIVRDLIRVISNISEPALRIKNDKGNTPLHVQDLEDKDLYRNKAAETPLFLAAFHGYKPIFLYLHMALLEATDTDLKSVDPGYRRNDGETALHCAIKWKYFDVAYEILLKEPSLAYAVNEVGITPLHLLASKPLVFKSGIYVEELEHETVYKRLIDSAIKELDESSIDDITHKFPKNNHTCIQFYQVLQTLAQFETTILLAARNGITEIVEYILNKFPLAIDDKSEGQNIVLLAAKNRQTHVLQLLLEQEFVKRKLIHVVDSDENNALH
ncbi:hypothetical protein ACB092_10G205600 [Castanea dentata]